MPAILSKELSSRLLGSEWSFGYNCYEVGHTWTPSCTSAALEVSVAAMSKIMPLYAALYAFSQLAVQRKLDVPSSLDTLKSVLRSSFFIFFHAYNGASMGCFLRNSLGRFYYRVLVCLPALLSSYSALLIEKPSRRQALAFYMLNLASEIVYRMAVTKGYFKPVRHGESLLFAASLAAWYHMIKRHGFGHDPVSGAFKLLVGRDEAASRAAHRNGRRPEEQPPRPGSPVIGAGRLGLGFGGSHASCPHKSQSCARYVLSPAPSRFLLGYALQALLGLARQPVALIKWPRAQLAKSLGSRASLRSGLFLMSLVSGGRLTSCLLRHLSGAERQWHAPAAGFAAGLSMLWAPRSTLSMYVMWKAIEQYFLLKVAKGPAFNFSILTIYAASASTILYAFALEPKFVRPSYMKFLDGISDHRLHQLNRMVLDVFGTGSSVGYEDYFPDLDPKYMSNQFKELIFNWMIQPYE